MRVLLLEDDERLARFLARLLSEEGLGVDACARGVDGIAHAARRPYDLFILDWTPTTEALSVCEGLRHSGWVAPILMFTGREATRDRVLALEAGADHCMVKPVDADEFVARVRALLRRSSGFAALRCGELEVNPVARRAKLSGMELTLTNRECTLLIHLLQRANLVVKRSDLLAHVWGMRFDPGSNLVEVYISRLREKLGDRAWMIETVRGVGYRLRQQQAA
jgi:DNA-binding response OmpR family regulator